jgi:hypothetical protein
MKYLPFVESSSTILIYALKDVRIQKSYISESTQNPELRLGKFRGCGTFYGLKMAARNNTTSYISKYEVKILIVKTPVQISGGVLITNFISLDSHERLSLPSQVPSVRTPKDTFRSR